MIVQQPHIYDIKTQLLASRPTFSARVQHLLHIDRLAALYHDYIDQAGCAGEIAVEGEAGACLERETALALAATSLLSHDSDTTLVV